MQNLNTPTWETKEGQEIPIAEMTDSHLDNAIAYLERRVVEIKDKLIEYFEHKIYVATREVALDAEIFYPMAHHDSGVAAAEYWGYAWAMEPWKSRLEQVKIGDPSGMNPVYQELIQERNRRKSV